MSPAQRIVLPHCALARRRPSYSIRILFPCGPVRHVRDVKRLEFLGAVASSNCCQDHALGSRLRSRHELHPPGMANGITRVLSGRYKADPARLPHS
jgi:hypothetical protein